MSFTNSALLANYLKESKLFGQGTHNELIAFKQPIHLYQLGTLTKWLFLFSRYQVFVYCVGCTSYSTYTILTKYQTYTKQIRELTDAEQTPKTKRKLEFIQRKHLKLMVLTPGLLLTSTLGIYVTIRMGRLLPRSIYYLPDQNKFTINYFSLFGGTKQTLVPQTAFSVNSNLSFFTKTCEFSIEENGQKRKISTKGPGNWSNKQLFMHLIR